jgi:hypothetical protein
VQLVLPVPDWYVPALQLAHVVDAFAPTAVEYDPVGQLKQLTAPVPD